MADRKTDWQQLQNDVCAQLGVDPTDRVSVAAVLNTLLRTGYVFTKPDMASTTSDRRAE